MKPEPGSPGRARIEISTGREEQPDLVQIYQNSTGLTLKQVQKQQSTTNYINVLQQIPLSWMGFILNHISTQFSKPHSNSKTNEQFTTKQLTTV